MKTDNLRWPFTVYLSRIFMMPPTMILLLISHKFLTNPTHAVAAEGITFSRPDAVTDARAIGAFSLVLAILILSCVFSKTRLRLGHTILILVMGLTLAVRLYGFGVDGTTIAMGDQRVKTMGEIVFLIVNVIGLVVQTLRSRPAATEPAFTAMGTRP